MVRKIFKWLYLLISGISFLLVLCLIAFFGYVYMAEDEVRAYIQDFQSYREYQNNEKIFEVIDVDDDIRTAYSIASNKNTKKPNNTEDPKIKIKTKKGYAYLRPSQIYYIESGNEYHRIIAMNGKPIELNKRETPLKNIGQLLSNYSCFYATKSYVINCAYIEQVERDSDFKSSKTFVIMENGNKIQLPESRVKPLIALLDEMHETN